MEVSYSYYGKEKRGFIIQSSTKYYNDTYGGKNYGERAISLVREKLGCEYVWAMQGPDTFDCSGLMQWAYNVLDVYIPRNADQQSEFGKKLADKKDLLPGDLVTFYTSTSRPNDVTHVGMYAGNGKFIHASSAYEKVVEMDLDTYPYKIASMNRCW
ncbi:Clan CA, family C40, NlpC/P60 superfamily cysteine peptidase [Trichomonas vaginalis G3]|uniref:Clan CA, family C40, NlpC/P60 superfamily cysteine peptidase n=1 Tax=Trichomonas vaginalis (strain ATCC PRA-98 / G3) TaxID=412133 RepID=A2EXF6_TRIV3|nr:murein DD-endopeptidase MEPH-related family [Trichomonas vaginalis G3]EAY02646.1 Clan CA, family C40, NlpC/P60 superfamily cysteine peptidase [Trichomonas vaginalis G3]KAI5550143.1 murein DD-endopeptidase MEPH-related family [Trichomonas vaginalis G3]|eukprot:XP_001314869.1 Clan CA, family C40, NlpC/P60 superfamily cysteine peptidase [Trichomonas vaginalis G3]